MSYFLCLAVPPEAAALLPSVFDARIHQMEVTHFPIGKLTQGDHHSWAAVLLQVGSSSATLIGKSSKRKNDHTDLLLAGVQNLLKNRPMRLCALTQSRTTRFIFMQGFWKMDIKLRWEFKPPNMYWLNSTLKETT